MKQLMLVLVLAMCAPFAAAQVCDVTYTLEVETADGHDVGNSSISIFGLPMADVLDNHKHNLRVLDALSKRQDKGGPYTIEVGEYRACDGKAKVKVEAGSVFVKGVTLRGANQVARVGLKETSEIIARYEAREGKGQKSGWDHKKAKKVKRNDLGVKQKD